MRFDNFERRKDRRYIICRTIEYILDSGPAHEEVLGLTVNISKCGLCFYTCKTLFRGKEIKIKRNPSQSYQAALVKWIEKITGNIYRVGLAL